jgi:ribosomal protein L11 methyltransferase
VFVVLATTEQGLSAAGARLDTLGVAAVDVVAPSENRRLLLAPVPDELTGVRVVSRLRNDGQSAVVRPAGGPQLGAWISHTRPIVVGGRLTVCFVWSEHDRRDLPNVVELDPDGGFGSGAHPATRLLLEDLVSLIAGGERVLDVGCGSGVLGLGVLRLGADRVMGVDIDPVAIGATRGNARLNGLEDRVEAALVPIREVGGAFDVVVANIGRAALVDLGPELVRRVAPGGWLAVSGFPSSQAEDVGERLRPLHVLRQRSCGEWSSLVLALRPTF